MFAVYILLIGFVLFNLICFVPIMAEFCTDMFLGSFYQIDIVEALNINILLTSTVPIKVYINADLDKKIIILENKDKAGVDQFLNLLTGDSYIGSSTNLSRRLKQYYTYGFISNPARSKSIIYSSILKNGYSNFSLIILEYCKIKDTINREQFYIDVINPTMNILQVAGNSLGFKHTKEALTKMKEAKKDKTLSIQTKAKISAALLGKLVSAETKALISLSKSGKNHPLYGKSRSIDTRDKISITSGTAIYVYSSDKSTLINTFSSFRKAAVFFNCNHITIKNYCSNERLFQDKWILSRSKFSSDKKS
jgi:group I intron endonuclease